MKLKDSLGRVVMVVTLFLAFPGLTQQPKGNSNLGEANEPTTYYFGLRTNAAPISSTDEDGNWKGYCHALIETLKKQISGNIEPVSITRGKRFTSRGDEVEELDAECGPNTITQGRINKELKINGRDGQFSKPFAWTGTKALVAEKNISKFADELELSELKFGVIGGTHTINVINAIYPTLIINNNIVLLKESKYGIEKLKKEEIQAYFNDELILMNRLKELQSSHEKYSILPEQLLSHEHYGIIVYNTNQEKNKQLLKDINSLLDKAEIKEIGSTKIKIFNNSYFQEFISSVSEEQQDNNLFNSLWSSRNLWYAFLVILLFIILSSILIHNPNIRFIRSNSFSQKRLQKNNNPNHRNNQETHVASSKSEYSAATHHIIVNNHNNIPFRNDNTQGDNMSERKTQINQNNSSFGVGYSEQVEANQLAANIHNYAPEQDLAQAAAKIQELLKQLEKTNPTATQEDKQAFINLAIPQEEKSRIVRALQAGGEKALEKFLNNPYVDVTMAIVKEWQKG